MNSRKPTVTLKITEARRKEMTIGRGKMRQALVVSVVLCLLLAGIYFLWPINSAPTTSNPQTAATYTPDSAVADANNSNADELAQALKEHLEKIKSLRREAEEPFNIYLSDSCLPAGKRQGEIVDPKKLAELSRCDNSIEKFAAYHEKLAALFENTKNLGPMETLVASLQAKAELGEQQQRQPPSSTSKEGSLLTSFLWGMAATLVISAVMLLPLMGKNFFSQRLMASTISQGFVSVNDSLSRLHEALTRPERLELVPEKVHAASHPTAKQAKAQADEQAHWSFNALSSEVRQGFSNLQSSLKPVLQHLDMYLVRLANQHDRQANQTPFKREPRKPPSQAHELSPLPAMPVKEYKTKFSVVDCVNPGYQTGYLEKTQNGELSVYQDDRSKEYYLIPNDERLQTPSYFHQKYAAYYDAIELRAGSIEVISPATVRPEGAQWRLKRKGTLTVHKLSQ
jgi:hypothetical protein